MDINQGLKPGASLRHGAYRIEKLLGQGGFGITYLALDLNLDRYVAIKEFFPKDYCDRDDTTSHVTLGTQSSKEFVYKLKAKFLKEARNIAKFDNPYIIRIHSAFEENNTAYYVMDYIEGETLAEKVKRDGPIPESKALQYIKKVGNALDYVHNHNVTHLDVKPANIIIRQDDGTPILIDFGLAKQYDAKGQQTSTTPTGISHGYAPMEQYSDGGVREFSPQTDLYSLGATLYFILSGVVPPQAAKLIEDDLTFPQIISPRLIPPISQAMATIRKNRFDSVATFIKKLDEATESNTIEGITIQPRASKYSPNEGIMSSSLSSSEDESTVLTNKKQERKRIWIIVSLVIIICALAAFGLFYIMSTSRGKEDSINTLIHSGDSILYEQLALFDKPNYEPSIENIQELEKVKIIYTDIENQSSKEFLNSTQIPNRLVLINRLINEIDGYEQSKEFAEKAKITDMTEEYLEFSRMTKKHEEKINQIIRFLK